MDIDAAIAAANGFPKLKYAAVERERRWLCRAIPADRVLRIEVITDLYVTGTRLRLRQAIPLAGGPPMLRLTRKVDIAPDTRVMTSIYLAPEEFALLTGLPGRRLRKTRHHLQAGAGVTASIDEFEGDLAGLILGEAEFDDDAAMAAWPMPDYALREVTDDPRYGGGSLVQNGRP